MAAASAFSSTGGTALGAALQKLLKLQAPAQPGVLTSPPPGTYDPAIDSQIGQSSRGLGDMLSSYITGYGEPGTALGGRQGEDFQTGQASINRSLGYGTADVNQSADRSLADLLTGRSRASQDYGTAVAGLDRNYQRLGSAQTQTSRQAGVQRGGALAQSLAKRTANEAIDRAPMDTGFSRFNADSALQEGRIGTDRGTALGRLQEGAASDLAGLKTNYLRGAEDANTQLGIAGRENSQFGLDANAQKFYQANVPLPLPAAAAAAVPKKKAQALTGSAFRRPPTVLGG